MVFYVLLDFGRSEGGIVDFSTILEFLHFIRFRDWKKDSNTSFKAGFRF
ncbi:hypothetical protein LEP1GSC165_4042 [Leptospira santarosai str. CBC523]|nr:hypothetical protein LEP1GSC039_1484 [Leptospira santarosai str. 2000027870]EMO12314.1 hypothetical protein LEP1GSC165_4042 [Leptospira santarosai str. CBC523]EMO83613.1 hypothetical protein LEP1GSC070_0807 [Leptospira santarosai str. AIM]